MVKFNTKFESNKQDWETPDELFKRLDNEFNFEIDLASSEHNKKIDRYYSIEDDAFSHDWIGSCWLNPPYTTEKYKLKDWVKRCYEQSFKNDVTIVALIPARTNTKWWHQYVMKAKEIRLLEGRVKFVGAEHGLPQPLAVIIFQKNELKYPLVCSYKVKNA